jgi:hypothetical protein
MKHLWSSNPVNHALTICSCSENCQGHSYIMGEMIDVVVHFEDEEDDL